MAKMDENGYAKIGQDGDTFLPLVVERAGLVQGAIKGDLVSFAHYVEQNGDLCRDPDVVMLDTGGRLYPIRYRLDLLGVDNDALEYDDQGQITGRYRVKMQADICAFCAIWAKNLIEQRPELG